MNIRYVGPGNLADDAITADSVADDSIDLAKLSATGTASATTFLRGDNTWATPATGTVGNDSVDSQHYVDGSIDTAHLGDLQVTTAKIAADAITGAKIADDAIDSEHYTDGSIDTAHIANLQITTGLIAADAVTGAKIADDAIDSEHYTDGSIDTAHIADDQITNALMADDAIGVAQLSATGTASSSTYLRGDNSWAAAGGGKVLQVVQTVLDDTQSTTSSSFVDMSPSLTASITPSASSSKILVNFTVTVGANEGWHAHFRLLRDSTAIGIGAANSNRKRATFEVSTGAIAIATPGSMTYLDSPSTTSSTAYKVQWAAESSGTVYLNRSDTWTDSANWMTGISTITLTEIGA